MSEQIRDLVMYSQKNICLLQYPEEFEVLVKAVADIKPERVLEIGTYAGGSLYCWMQVAADDALIVSVDLPYSQPGGYSELNAEIFLSWVRDQQRLILIRGNSHLPSTLLQVTQALNGEMFDCLFIDAGHLYEDVRQDWLTYSPLVRSGGIIVLHDIAQCIGVERLWLEIRDGYDYHEIRAYPGGDKYGIGWLVQQ